MLYKQHSQTKALFVKTITDRQKLAHIFIKITIYQVASQKSVQASFKVEKLPLR